MTNSFRSRLDQAIRTRHLQCAGILLFTLVMLLAGIDRVPVSREQELRVALTARGMAEGGSWLIPHYQDEVRLKKPPLMYWIVAGACRVAGTTRSVLATRLPTMLFGVALVALIYFGGRPILGRCRALAGALTCATSFLFLRFARLGETDIPLAFFVTLAVFLSLGALRSRRPVGWWLGAGVSAGLGFMIKGPAAAVLPFAAVAAALACTPALRRGRPFMGMAAALPAFACVALPWYAYVFFAPAAAEAAGAAVNSELHALGEGTAHRGPLVYYLYTLPYALAPWGLLLPVAAWEWWRHARGGRSGPRFLMAWFLSSILVLSLVPSKQLHYVTLLLAPSCLILGSFLHSGLKRIARWRARAVRGYLVGLDGLFAFAAVALALAPIYRPGLPPLPCTAVAAVLLALAAAGWVFRRAHGPQPMLVVALLMAVTQGAYVIVLAPHIEPTTAYSEFARAASDTLDHAHVIRFHGAKRNTLEYYAGRRFEDIRDPMTAAQKISPGEVFVWSTNRHAPEPELAPARTPALEVRRGDVCVRLFTPD